MKHETALKKVGGLCLMKQKSMENISDQYLILIKKHHFANYNLTSGDYPTVICPSCKRCLRDRDKFGHEAKGKLPPLRYHKMRGTRTSRNFQQFQCSWCQEGQEVQETLGCDLGRQSGIRLPKCGGSHQSSHGPLWDWPKSLSGAQNSSYRPVCLAPRIALTDQTVWRPE